MKESLTENWESRLQSAASSLPYPPTPDIAGKVRRRLAGRRGPLSLAYRRTAWAAAVVVIILIATMLFIPPVRAAILDFLQIGAVRIFLVEPTATPTPTPAPSTPAATQAVTKQSTPASPTPAPIYLKSLLDLQGETTLEAALDRLRFTPSLPTYPPDLGNPDRVFLQDMDGQVLFLVWANPEHPDRIRLSLHIISPGSWAVIKMGPEVIDQTKVKGQEALWAEGPYPLRLTNGAMDIRRMVAGHVLIWEQDGLTYRLESDLSMDEAIKVAESLTAISP